MLSAEERLERLEKVLEELEELSHSVPVIVEGIRDVAALKKLGITNNVLPINKGTSILVFCERLSRKHVRAVILTDWDRKGGQLARMLRDGLSSNGVRIDDDIRAQIVILSKKEIGDIESLPTFVERLRRMRLAKSGERAVVEG